MQYIGTINAYCNLKMNSLGHPIKRSDYATVLDFAQAVRDWHASQNTAKDWAAPLGSQRCDNDANPSYERDAERAMDEAYWGCEVNLI